MVAIASAIVSAPVVAARSVAMKPASKATTFKAATVSAKKASAFQVCLSFILSNALQQCVCSVSPWVAQLHQCGGKGFDSCAMLHRNTFLDMFVCVCVGVEPN